MPESASNVVRSREAIARARAIRAAAREVVGRPRRLAPGSIRLTADVPAAPPVTLGPEAIILLRRLREIHARRPSREALLSALLDAVIEATRADRGNVQLVNPTTGALEIAAQREFGPDFLAFFREVRDVGSACGAAMRSRRCAVVEDVRTHSTFAGSPAREVVLDAGVLAVQSTPIIGPSGQLVGMVSTHFRAPGRVPAPRLHLVALIARQAAASLSMQ
jgi:GAF domain-containing protein